MFKIMSYVLKLVPELKIRFYLSVIFKIIESLVVGSPYGFLVLTLSDLLNKTLTMDKILYYTIGLFSCFLIQGIFFYLYSRASYPIGTLLSERLRIIVGEHLRKLSLGDIREKSTGELNSTISDDLIWVAHVPTMVIPTLIAAFSLPFIVTLFLLFINIKLALFAILVLPIAAFFFLVSQNKLKSIRSDRHQSVSLLNSKLIEYVQGIEVIKSFNLTGDRFKAFEQSILKMKTVNLNLEYKLTPLFQIFKCTLDLGFILILFSGSWFLVNQEIDLFTFLVFLILGLRLFESFKSIDFSFLVASMAKVTMEKIDQIMNISPLPQPEIGKKPVSFDIEFKNVYFQYDQKPLLKKINFKVPERSITALVGPSGSGKTTVTNLIARFWDIQSGSILIGGYDIREIKSDDLLENISMVFQDVYLFNDTIYNNIGYGSKNPTTDDIIRCAKTAQCHSFISALPDGYQTMVGEGGMNLSGGEKQRISIARAILKDAPIILLDEATASVDAENEKQIQNAIDSLVKSKTLIIIAHRLSTIKEADQILIINEEGKIDGKGKHEELIQNNKLYQRLWYGRQEAKKWRLNHRPTNKNIDTAEKTDSGNILRFQK